MADRIAEEGKIQQELDAELVQQITKRNKYFGMVFGLILTSLIISCSTGLSLYPYQNAFRELERNWKTFPITDIKVVKNGYCPLGYINLLHGEWPGTRSTCYTKGDNGTKIIQYACSSFPEEPPIEHIFEAVDEVTFSQIFSHKICGKREGDSYKITKKQKNEDSSSFCPSGYTQCGGQRETAVCVENGQLCPINDIILKETPSEIPSGYEVLNLGSIYLAYSRDANKLPVVELKITENGVCADPKEKQASNGRNYYPILNNYQQSCSQSISRFTEDPRHHLLHKVLEKDLFDQNEVGESLLDLPQYRHLDGSKYTWDILQTNYYGVSPTCEDKHGSIQEKVLAEIKIASQVYGLNSSEVLYILFVLIVFGLAAMALSDQKEKCSKITDFAYCTTLTLSILVSIKIFHNMIKKGSEYGEVTQILESSQCFDPFTLAIFTGYTERLEFLRLINAVAMIFSIIVILLSSNFSYKLFKGKFQKLYSEPEVRRVHQD